jgi:hypothetical protein
MSARVPGRELPDAITGEQCAIGYIYEREDTGSSAALPITSRSRRTSDSEPAF